MQPNETVSQRNLVGNGIITNLEGRLIDLGRYAAESQSIALMQQWREACEQQEITQDPHHTVERKRLALAIRQMIGIPPEVWDLIQPTHGKIEQLIRKHALGT